MANAIHTQTPLLPPKDKTVVVLGHKPDFAILANDNRRPIAQAIYKPVSCAMTRANKMSRNQNALPDLHVECLRNRRSQRQIGRDLPTKPVAIQTMLLKKYGHIREVVEAALRFGIFYHVRTGHRGKSPRTGDNRIIGDAKKPVSQCLTETFI